MHAVLNGNVEIIKFLFGDIDERNKKIAKIYSMNEKMKTRTVSGSRRILYSL